MIPLINKNRLLTWLLYCAGLIACLTWVNKCSGQCNLNSLLDEFGNCQDTCSCDLDASGSVNSFDLLNGLATFNEDGLKITPLDIVPRWNGFYNDAGAGNDGYTLYPTIQDTELTWSDIETSCQVTWWIGDYLIWIGTEIQFNQNLSPELCSGVFPLTVKILHRGFLYERTEPSVLNIGWFEAAPCPFGLSVIDADLASFEMSPFWNPLAPPFQYCQNCIDGE